MKLASLKTGGRDGSLIIVSRDLKSAVSAAAIAPSLQNALDNWRAVEPELQKLSQALNSGKAHNSFALDTKLLASPLPRAYQWVDGSAYLNHVELVRKARGAEMPPDFYQDPLMYQGCSDSFYGPCDPISLENEAWGIDFESEVAVITDDTPMGVSTEDAAKHIKLVMLVNDVSLRGLIPAELAKGFGFLQSKPASAFSPVAVTPDELGAAWRDCKVHLPLRTFWNEKLVGEPNAGEDMNFSLARLVAHAAMTRKLCAGTIVGSGTVSNRDSSRGYSCIQEKRTLEIIATGKPVTSFLHFGDRVKIEMLDANAQSIFGSIDQMLEQYKK